MTGSSAPFGSRTRPAPRGGATLSGRSPIWWGSVWPEDAPGTAGSRDFVRAVANMVALRLADASIVPVAREPGAIGKPITAPETVMRNFAADLRPAEIDPSALHAEIYPSMPVMVLRFTDATAM